MTEKNSWEPSLIYNFLILANFISCPFHTKFSLYFYISAIAIAHDSSFKTDQAILVLPLDMLKFDAHEKLTQDVLKHFGKVYSVFFLD